MNTEKRGCARVGAVRPLGSRSRATISREALSREAKASFHAAGLANTALTNADIAGMDALQVMSHTMTAEACAGRWLVAAEIAAKIAKYRFVKLMRSFPNDRAPLMDASR